MSKHCQPKRQAAKKVPRYSVEATLAERLATEQTVIGLLTEAGFVRIGMSESRLVHTASGKPIQFKPRKRYENCDHVRVTVGLMVTYFYTVGDGGVSQPIASHKTLDIKAIRATLARL